jgi:hypothetical protein
MTPGEKYKRMIAAAEALHRELIELEVDSAFCDAVFNAVSLKAGSMLPPIVGIMNLPLDSSQVN